MEADRQRMEAERQIMEQMFQWMQRVFTRGWIESSQEDGSTSATNVIPCSTPPSRTPVSIGNLVCMFLP